MLECAHTIGRSGLFIGQCWLDNEHPDACRIVTIDPLLRVVEIEDGGGRFQRDTIEHFLSTHHAEPG